MGQFTQVVKVTGNAVHNTSLKELAKLSEYASDFRIQTVRNGVAHYIEYDFEFPYSQLEVVSELLKKLKE